MNQFYLAGQVVTRTIPLVDPIDGSTIAATAVSYRVLDHLGAEVVASTAVSPFAEGTEEVEVAVSGANNALPEGYKRSLRVIELTITTAEGQRLLTDMYFIDAIDVLTVPTNSFQTLFQAELLASEMPDIPGWESATREKKIAAMIQARLNIARLQFRFAFNDYQSIVEPEFGISDILSLTEAEFNNLSAEFKAALTRAQIYEADELLGGNPYEERRRAGLMSESIGESSMMFRPGTPIRLPVAERTLKALAKYVSRGIRIGRA